MKKRVFLLISIFYLFSATRISAASDFVVKQFASNIVINQDTSLSVTEEIVADFSVKRHGIYRDIPNIYKIDGKRINSNIKVLGVFDKAGNQIPYDVSKNGQYVNIKIGDPERYVFGEQSYVIEYFVENILQEFENHIEFYWNVTGHEWETEIEMASVKVKSEFASITNADCFSGLAGMTSKNCNFEVYSNELAQFNSTKSVGQGSDFTIVLALDKLNNSLIFPSTTERLADQFLNNWGYLMAPLPFLAMAYFWLKYGRDKRYLSDNVYYEPEEKQTKRVSVFKRAHLPMVYAPIDNVSPGELGVIVDERVDLRDVVAEIAELARLKYLKMEIISKKKFIGRDVDYTFTKLSKDDSDLRDYQKFLLSKIFSGDKKSVKLSELENKFYKHLPKFRDKIYDWVTKEGYFPKNPQKVLRNWVAVFVAVEVITAALVFLYFNLVGNFIPLIVFGVLSGLGFILVFLMPRKTPKGYSMHRQGKGLSYFVDKGKWRHEVAEKKLFFEEMLPLAISLGVVKKLARDMEKLKVAPPSYVHAASNAVIYNNIGNMDSKVATSVGSSPKSSGGSGFSGGSSGGGFGGGGGGSW